MPRVVIDLDDDEDRAMKIYSAKEGYSRKDLAIKRVIREYFKLESERRK